MVVDRVDNGVLNVTFCPDCSWCSHCPPHWTRLSLLCLELHSTILTPPADCRDAAGVSEWSMTMNVFVPRKLGYGMSDLLLYWCKTLDAIPNLSSHLMTFDWDSQSEAKKAPLCRQLWTTDCAKLKMIFSILIHAHYSTFHNIFCQRFDLLSIIILTLYSMRWGELIYHSSYLIWMIVHFTGSEWCDCTGSVFSIFPSGWSYWWSHCSIIVLWGVSLYIWCSLQWCAGWTNIYTLSTHYLHTIYTLSIHYLHTIYTVSVSGAVSAGVLGADSVTRLLGESIAGGQSGNTRVLTSSATSSNQQPTPGRLSGSSGCSSWCRNRGKHTWNFSVFLKIKWINMMV